MNEGPRGGFRKFWTRALIAVCLIGAIGASLFARISWHQYFRYVTTQFGWPFVAAVLTAGVIFVVALFTAKRRRASGILAVSMFISVVLHMLTASMFRFVVVGNTVANVVPAENRQMVSFDLPSLTESILSQEVRAEFTAITMPESRRFETEKNSRPEPVEKPIVKPQPQLKPKNLPDPAPEKAKPAFASKTGPAAKEVLATLPVKAPDITQTKIAMLKPAPNANEAPRPPRPATREIKPAPVPRERPDLLAEPPAAAPTVKLKDAQRDPLREQMDVTPRRPMEPTVKEIMRNTAIAATVDELKLPAAKTRAAANASPPEPRLAPKRAFPVSHQAAPLTEAPAPGPVSRELITTVPKVDSASLAEAAPARAERQPTVNDQTMRDGAERPRSLVEPVRMKDTVAGMTGKKSAEPGPTPVASARENLRADRTARTLAGAESPLVQPKAQLDLEARPIEDRTLVASRPGATGPARVDRPGVQEQLAKAMGREAVNQPMLDVGRNIEAPRNASADTGSRGTAPTSDRGRESAPSKAETGVANGAIGSERRNALPAANLTVRPSSDTAVYGIPDVSSAQPQAATPTAEEQLSLPAGSRPSSQPDIVMEGTAAAAADSGTGTVDSPVVLPAGRHELATVKSQGGLSQAEAGAVLTERPLGETPAAVSHHSLVGRSSVAVFGREARPAAAAQEMLPIGSAGEMERADAALAKLVPGVAQAAQDDRLGKGAAEGGETQTELDQAEMRTGKAAGKLADGGAAVPPHGKTSSISGILGGSAASRTAESSFSTVSFGGPDFSAMTPSTEAQTPGVGQNTLSTIPGTPATRLDPVALGLSGREAASRAGPSSETSAVSAGPSALSEVRATKAGGEAIRDTVPAGENPVFDTSGLSLSASRPPARMELAFAGGSAAQTEVRAEISAANMPGDADRTLITAELTSVPASVPEKAIYKLRAPERRRAFIEELGGSDQTEQAMERALVWLAKAQSDDGRWDVDGFKTLAQCGGPGDRKDGDAALTGLCLLSYLGAGYTHVKGDHKETVRKALNWLVVGQKADGDLQRDGQMYGQAMATAALCECYSMTGDQRLREPVDRAVDFILKAQNPGAGWRYLPRQDNDTSVTGWQVLALKSAMIAGIPFPPEHFQWVEAWLDKVRRGQEGGLYTYMPGHGATPTMTAEGWFCQLLMREQTRTRGQAETIPFLMAHPPVWSPKEHTINLYYWYYATLALHLSGAAEFKQWNQALTQALLTGQVKSGPAAGSWDPVCVLGDRGGRVYSTATAALCLEVYYRYLPFYKQ